MEKKSAISRDRIENPRLHIPKMGKFVFVDSGSADSISLCERLMGSDPSKDAMLTEVSAPADNERESIATACEPDIAGTELCLRNASGILGKSLGMRILKPVSNPVWSPVLSIRHIDNDHESNCPPIIRSDVDQAFPWKENRPMIFTFSFIASNRSPSMNWRLCGGRWYRFRRSRWGFRP